jgi:acetolactate synthase-1/2/3 large subunit
MRLADYLWKRIFELTGTRHCFTLAGGGIMHLIDALEKSPITPVYMLDERSAAIAADMYGRRNGTPGLLLVTTGPGLTNSLTGIWGAHMDSSPLIVVCGQVNDYAQKDRQKGIQEVPNIRVIDGLMDGMVTNFYNSEWTEGAEDTIKYCTNKRPSISLFTIRLDAQAGECINAKSN